MGLFICKAMGTEIIYFRFVNQKDFSLVSIASERKNEKAMKEF